MANDELLRILTAEGAPTDTFKQRGQVHRDGDWHATVHLWLINSSAELLFQKRSDNAELHPGLWDVSAAGHVVGDESIETSLQREALEELGVDIGVEEATELFILKTDTQSGALLERVFQHIFLINREIGLNELRPQVAEVAGLEWRHYSILKNIVSDSTGFVPRIPEYEQLLGYLNRINTR